MEDCLLIYLDDIILHTKDIESHKQKLEEMFERLSKAKLQLSLNKCSFFLNQASFLGFIITPKGLLANPEKVKPLARAPRPQRLRDLRGLLGSFNVFKKFIPLYSHFAKPISDLSRCFGANAKKSSRIAWTPEAEEGFIKLKDVERYSMRTQKLCVS